MCLKDQQTNQPIPSLKKKNQPMKLNNSFWYLTWYFKECDIIYIYTLSFFTFRL